MGMKMSDRYKIQIKTFAAFKRKQSESKTFPRCSYDSIEVVVMDSLDSVKEFRTEIVEIGKFGRQGYSHVVTKIKCPLCDLVLEIDKLWLAFICDNHTQRKIWEVVRIYEKDGKKFK